MSTEEYAKIKEQLQLERDKNIDLKFQRLDEKMDQVLEILRENVRKNDINADRISILEEQHRNCPINAVKIELKRYARETKAIRNIADSYKTYWISHIGINFGVFMICTLLLLLIGADGLIEIIKLFKF